LNTVVKDSKTIRPSNKKILVTILSMGSDGVGIIRKDDVLIVRFYRAGGCGRISKNVCGYLEKRLIDMRIVVLEYSSRDSLVCYQAFVREPGVCLEKTTRLTAAHLSSLYRGV
jgi:hypothetical protein